MSEEDLVFADPNEVEAPKTEAKAPEHPDEKVFKPEGELVRIMIPDAHGHTGVIRAPHPDFILGEKQVVMKRNEEISVDARLLGWLDQFEFVTYKQDTDSDGHKFGPLRPIINKLFPFVRLG